MPVSRIEHIGIMVKDLEASIKFYREVVGLELKYSLLHTDQVIQLAFLGFSHQDETELELIHGYSGELANEGRFHHVAFRVDNIEEEIERLENLNVHFRDTEITTLPDGSKYIFFYGPDGEFIEFFQSTRNL
ncbi:MAG: glyoxalase [Bacilli bacterium]|nr:glyoxalase [Bacilli bacterium]